MLNEWKSFGNSFLFKKVGNKWSTGRDLGLRTRNVNCFELLNYVCRGGPIFLSFPGLILILDMSYSVFPFLACSKLMTFSLYFWFWECMMVYVRHRNRIKLSVPWIVSLLLQAPVYLHSWRKAFRFLVSVNATSGNWLTSLSLAFLSVKCR